MQEKHEKDVDTYKQLIGRKSKTATKPLIVNNIDISDSTEIPEQFNTYFTIIAHILDSEI